MLTALSEEFGYAADPVALANRLTLLLGSPDLHQLWVAEVDGETAGWIHGFWRPLLESPAAVEVGGLAVGERWRRQGVGAALLATCENWARSKGATLITLRSAAYGEDIPDFYAEQGYQPGTNQNIFRKQL